MRIRALRLLISVTLLLSIILSLSVDQSLAEETNTSVRKSPYFTRRGEPEPEATELPAKSNRRGDDLSVDKLEVRLFELVNRDRKKEHAPPVTLNAKLSELARRHAEDMLKRDYFNHVTPDEQGTQERARKLGLKCPVFENLGYQSGDYTALQMVEDLEQTFMKEPKNQRNHRYIDRKSVV